MPDLDIRSLPPSDDPAADLGDDGTLVVEDHTFAIVGEWGITSELSDAAFRVYSMLLRYGGTSGHRMPSRALLGRRLHRSVDSIDRALRELVSAGIVRIEHRHDGRQYRSNRYHVRTTNPIRSAPAEGADGGGRRSAATPVTADRGGRTGVATPGRRSAVRVAADLRPYPEVLTQRQPPPPLASTVPAANDRDLLTTCGIDDLEAVSGRCVKLRTALGRPTARWTPKCLLIAIKLATVRGWPPTDVVQALLAVAADPDTRSPARLAEAGPWWDTTPADTAEDAGDDLGELEARLAELGGHRPALQAQARAELSSEGMPLTRATVTRRAIAILDRQDQPA